MMPPTYLFQPSLVECTQRKIVTDLKNDGCERMHRKYVPSPFPYHSVLRIMSKNSCQNRRCRRIVINAHG